jgi:hypothetical protein
VDPNQLALNQFFMSMSTPVDGDVFRKIDGI